MERLNQEPKRCTGLLRVFPDARSCLRLIQAEAVEPHETWLDATRYLDMAHLAEHKNEALQELEEPQAADGGRRDGRCAPRFPGVRPAERNQRP